MKRDVFLFVVVVFAIVSSIVFYFDYSKNCGSLNCVVRYVSDGGVVSDTDFVSQNLGLLDYEKESNPVVFIVKKAVSIIIAPFVGDGKVLFAPGDTDPVIT